MQSKSNLTFKQMMKIQRKKSVEYQFQNGKSIFMYQFPIKLSWAVTAHKSKGQTLSKVAIFSSLFKKMLSIQSCYDSDEALWHF